MKVINSSRTKDAFLGTCLRELWLEVSKYAFELRAVHLPGVDNRVADWLSRWNLDPKYSQSFYQFIGGELERYEEVFTTPEMFTFSKKL